MIITPQIEAELARWLDTYWKTYLSGNLDTWANFIKDDYYNIGGTKEEIWHSKQEILDYTNVIMDQMLGKAELRNQTVEAEAYGDFVMVNEFTDMYVLIDGVWVFYGPFRMSSLMEKTETGWIVQHQHGSYPDMKATEGEAFAADALRAENLRLQAAVDERTKELENKNKELEIETALERVRAVAMGMKAPDDMLQVCRVISDELSQFGIQGIRNVQTVIIQEKRKIYDCYQYFPAYQHEILEHTEYLKNQVEGTLVNRMLEARDGYFEGSLTGQELQDFRTHRKEENHLPDPLMDEVDGIFYFFYSIGPGALGITLYEELSSDGLAIFKRFHQVFSLAYSRFRDIEKAEAHAREIEIDLALERVRAQTMAMHNSEDVGKCIVKMFGELTGLGVDEGTRFGIGILNHDDENNQLWTASKDGEEVKMHIGNLDMNLHPLLKSARKAWKAQTPLHEYVLEGEDLLDYYKMLNKAPDYKIQIPIEKLLQREIQHCFIFEHGFFYAFSSREFQPELIHTTQRFTSQFAQTYQRYLDLIRAEAQTREARIEAALEKVRSRSLAMHKSEELKEVIQVVCDQFLQLKIHVDHAGFIIDYKNRDDMHIWLADQQQGVPSEITFPYFDSPHWNSFREAKAKGDNFFANLLPFEVKNKFYRDLFELIPELTEAAQQAILSKPALVISTVLRDDVGLYIEHYSETPFTSEENAILMRFGNVFQQTYTRFLDLQKAEIQTRESQINLAVERVRAQSMAMHHPDDLDKVNKEILSQLNWLQVPGLSGVTFYLIDENGWVKAWDFSSPGNMGEQSSYTLQFDSNRHEMLGFPFKILQQTDLNYFVADYPLEKLEKAVYEFEEIDSAMAKIVKEALSTGALTHQWTTCARISNGMLGIDLVIPPSEDTKTIGLKIAGAFNQAYIRFLDLQKAEAQARESEIQLALERVRAKTMAMHSSSDLGSTSAVLFQQIADLGFETWSCGFCIWKEGDHIEAWMGADTAGSSLSPILLNYKEETTHYEIYKSFLEGESSHERVWEGLELEAHYDYMQTIPSVKTAFSQLFAAGLTLPTYQCYNIGFFKQGYLMIITKKQNPELKDLSVRFANVFEQTYTRFLDLQKAEAQTREAEIELALERVRARTMAMQHSDELAEASFLLDQQVRSLGIRTRGCAFHIYGENDSTEWFSSEQGTMPVYYTPRENVFLEYYEAGQRGETIYIKEFAGEVCAAHYDYLCTLPVMGEALKELKASGGSFPERQIDHATFFKYGYLLFITLEDVPDSHDIFKRFAKVFEQTYTRFLDLQKAEAQAREARIEAALEKIRARTMGMQHSDELPEAANLLFLEVQALGIPSWSAGYNILEDDKKSAMCWMSSEEVLQKPFQLRLWGEDSFDEMREFILSDQTMLVQELGGKAIEDHYRHMKSFPDLKPTFDEIDEKGLSLPTYQINHLCKFTQGFVLFITYEKVPEAHDIFMRFTKVFEQTYTRFLDLQKAERQAREAKIELSLERIRAQVTAMRESEELLEIVVTMRKEFVSLGHEAQYFWHMRWLPETYAKAMTSGDGTQIGMIMSLPRHIHGNIPAVVAWEKSDEPTHILAMDTELAVDYIDTMIKLGNFERVDPQAPTLDDIRHIGGLTFVMARTTHGEIGYSLPGEVPNPPQESIETLTRFAGVFDLAYRRFEDLLMAEKQNRKSKIELALERVRARAMAMQEPEELIEVAQVMREEMGILGVEELETSSIYINKSSEGAAECWYSLKDIRSGATTNVADHFNLNYNDTWVGRQMIEFHRGKSAETSIIMQGENRKEWINYCAKQSPKFEGYYGTEIPERTYHLTKFSNGAIGAATPGEISNESWDLLRRAAAVFSLAYSRFKDLSQAREDLKKLKIAKARAEKALKDLKAAQDQLVQQEKLASLGQLTAGIAHEIKNPLNFVNNFSDLSRELIEEVFAELANLESSETKEEIIAILQDVQSNLTKVHEHGSRADSIVTSMLQHSRASGSKREPKPFNPLVKEFVNLSFHGMRAGKSPINVDIDLQLDPQVGDVTLISEDFSRVILNLCNNAFDAMRDKLKLEVGSGKSEAYLPKLTVKTALQKDKVILSIGDNGGGIPKEIQDKILQPFFTTKKGTDGTGLGLSITHDIVKAHGGELDIQSQPGNTIFKIHLTL
jgi:signal transduction histidine kinase